MYKCKYTTYIHLLAFFNTNGENGTLATESKTVN